jgi:hypothetical protein
MLATAAGVRHDLIRGISPGRPLAIVAVTPRPGDGIPFHKLSQWLAYSLVRRFQGAGLHVSELDGLTGPPNIAMADCSSIAALSNPRPEPPARPPALSEPVVEWRALTVTLLDRLAVLVRERLGMNAGEFPLAKVLEGSWAAGRGSRSSDAKTAAAAHHRQRRYCF